MNDTWIIFHLTTIILILVTTAQVWSSFKSANKNREAGIYGFIGLLVAFIYLTILLGTLGSFKQPAELMSKLLYFKINLLTLGILVIVIRALSWLISKYLVPQINRKNIEAKITKKGESKRQKGSKTIFADPLINDISNWYVISGNPQISSIRGNEQTKSLLLDEYNGDRRNTFITPNNVNIKKGKITCDVYLERESLLNIVIGANSDFTCFIMVRIDSRMGSSNGILIAHNSVNWDYIEESKQTVLHDRWYHVDVLFENHKYIKLLLDKKVNVRKYDKTINTDGNIGLFNEIKRVFINNFAVSK